MLLDLKLLESLAHSHTWITNRGGHFGRRGKLGNRPTEFPVVEKDLWVFIFSLPKVFNR